MCKKRSKLEVEGPVPTVGGEGSAIAGAGLGSGVGSIVAGKKVTRHGLQTSE